MKVAATPCRCASTITIRLCESATLWGCQKLKEHVKEHTLLATAPADSAETFTVAQRTQRALCYREGGYKRRPDPHPRRY
jgi:hypothetical protein